MGPGAAVGGRRPLVEDPRLGALAAAHRLGEDVALAPALEHRLLELRERLARVDGAEGHRSQDGSLRPQPPPGGPQGRVGKDPMPCRYVPSRSQKSTVNDPSGRSPKPRAQLPVGVPLLDADRAVRPLAEAAADVAAVVEQLDAGRAVRPDAEAGAVAALGVPQLDATRRGPAPGRGRRRRGGGRRSSQIARPLGRPSPCITRDALAAGGVDQVQRRRAAGALRGREQRPHRAVAVAQAEERRPVRREAERERGRCRPRRRGRARPRRPRRARAARARCPSSSTSSKALARTVAHAVRAVTPSRRELAAERGELALLGVVERGERRRHAPGVLGEQPVDDLAAQLRRAHGRPRAGP